MSKINNDKITYIYELIDPRDNKTRYIGKTIRDLDKRLYEHIYFAKNRNETYVHNWINSLIKNDLKPILNVIDKCKWKESAFWEIFYISLYRSWGFKLTNLSNGGDGVLGRMTEKQKTNIYKSQKKRKIFQYNYDTGDFIKEWESASMVKKSLNLATENIRNTCNPKSKRKSAGGFFWRYYKVDNLFKIDKETCLKTSQYKIGSMGGTAFWQSTENREKRTNSIRNILGIYSLYEIDLQGNILKIYKNPSDATRIYGSKVLLLLKGKVKTFKNRFWIDKNKWDNLNNSEKEKYLQNLNKIKHCPISEDKVIKVYCSKGTNVEIAQKYNLCRGQVQRIRNGKTYKWITKNL